jgi:AraC-like DNA-binding protein
LIESFLFLFTGIIGSVTIALMITSYKSNPFCNAFLLLIIILVSYRFLVQGSYGLGLQFFLKPDKGTSSIFYLVIAPSFYLYHKNITLQNKVFNPKDLKHIVFIGLLYLLNINSYVRNSFIFHFGKITNFIFIALFLMFYITAIYRTLSKKVWFKKDLLVNNTHFSLVKNWTIYLFSINVLGVLILLASISTEIINGHSLSGKSIAILMLLFWLFIYFKILFTPEILYGLPILNERLSKFEFITEENNENTIPINNNWILEINNKNSNEQDLKLQEKIISNILSYTQEVDNLSDEEHIFRNPKTSTSDLANKLGVPTSHIVYLFKYHSRVSFSEYRMHSRIKDSINLIENGYLKTNTLESLAHKTGFASYNPFYIAFKKITSYSPQDYLKSIKF